MATISEIKTELAGLTDSNSTRLAELLLDKRIGVRSLAKTRQKQLLSVGKEQARLETLLTYERALYQQDIHLIAGIDEVGRGPLAGPVVAAAVILPENCKISHLNDSKQIPKKQHEEIYQAVQEKALAIGLGSCTAAQIDEVNIYEATKLAMLEAVDQLAIEPEHLLIDAMKLDSPIPQTSIIKGDAKSMSIAAASIVAKVTRDRLMTEYSELYPEYGFDHNAGYGTKEHLAALEKYGLSPIHRLSFEPVRLLL